MPGKLPGGYSCGLAIPLSSVSKTRPSVCAAAGLLCQPPRQALLENGVALTTKHSQVAGKLRGEILVQLEFHLARMGTSRSSWASSAA
jgi:hypothetical protein